MYYYPFCVTIAWWFYVIGDWKHANCKNMLLFSSIIHINRVWKIQLIAERESWWSGIYVCVATDLFYIYYGDVGLGKSLSEDSISCCLWTFNYLTLKTHTHLLPVVHQKIPLYAFWRWKVCSPFYCLVTHSKGYKTIKPLNGICCMGLDSDGFMLVEGVEPRVEPT